MGVICYSTFIDQYSAEPSSKTTYKVLGNSFHFFELSHLYETFLAGFVVI